MPKLLIERKICKIIDRSPNLIKILDHKPKPYKSQIIIKHWGIQYDDGIIYGFVPANWMDLEPDLFNYSFLLNCKWL